MYGHLAWQVITQRTEALHGSPTSASTATEANHPGFGSLTSKYSACHDRNKVAHHGQRGIRNRIAIFSLYSY